MTIQLIFAPFLHPDHAELLLQILKLGEQAVPLPPRQDACYIAPADCSPEWLVWSNVQAFSSFLAGSICVLGFSRPVCSHASYSPLAMYSHCCSLCSDLAAAVGADASADAVLAALGVSAGADGGGKKKKKRGGKKNKGDESAAPAADAAAAKPKKLTGAVAKAKAAQEARKAAEEAARQEAEAAAAEARAAAAEARAEEAAAAAAREVARQQREAAKKTGTYMTKGQKAKLAAQRARLESMRAAGVEVKGVKAEEGEGEGGAATATASGTVSQAAMNSRKKKKGKKGKSAAPAVPQAASPPAEPAAAAAAAAPEVLAAASAVTAAGTIDASEATWEDLLGTDADDQATGVAKAISGATLAAGFEGDWDAEEEGAADDIGVQDTTASGAGNSEEAQLAAVAARQGAAAADALAGYDLEERIEMSRERREERKAQAKAVRSKDNLRSPICCVMGHVDTGKTKLLDKIRRTNVQGGEAGGITQQIGATYFPIDRLRRSTDKLNKDASLEYKIPGLLVIDTPGHESFTNLRSRGSSLCDIAVLVIDIMHGLEPQTIESMNLLRKGKTPFIVALNKVDRLYGWKAIENNPIQDSLAAMPSSTQDEFETRTKKVITQLAEQGLNAKLYYENDNPKSVLSVVPTSAHTGEGVPDLLTVLVRLTQQLMSAKLSYVDFPVATVLEVKGVDGLGTTVDIVLVNGKLKVGDQIVVCGMHEPIVTHVRALLTPPPAKEIRIKADYVHHKEVTGAMGIKIAAPGLGDAVAGTQLLVVHKDDEVEQLKEDVMADLEAVTSGFRKQPTGVFVQASTLGSLEALLEYLKTQDPPIPIAGVNLGPIHKRHVLETSAMLDREDPRFAVMLAFDVRVTPEAQAYADSNGVRIFTADIIYHLTDQFEKYMAEEKAKRQAAAAQVAVFPARLSIVPTAVFNKKNPIVLGCTVTQGRLRIGTPLCVVTGANERGEPMVVELGKVTSIQHNHEEKEFAKAGDPDVAVKIEGSDEQRHIAYGRHFDHTHELYSRISRDSIDALKSEFRSDVSKDEWKVVIELKKILGVA